MDRRLHALLLSSGLAAALLLAACATGDGGRPPPAAAGPPPRADAGPPPGCGQLFVSPAGEPFRRAPDASGCPLRTWFTGADTNGDGALTRTEFRNDALRFFAVLDVDGNGVVDGEELQRYEHRILPELLGRGPGPGAALDARPRLIPAAFQMGGGMGGGGGGRGGRHGGDGNAAPSGGGKTTLREGAGASRFGLLSEPEPVAAADLDFDGRITRAEFATRADQRFASLDEAESGRLTYANLEQRLRERARESGRSGGGGAAPGGGGRRGGGVRGGRGGGSPGA